MRSGGEGSFGAWSDTLEKYPRMPFFVVDLPTFSGISISSSDGAGDKDESDERSDESWSLGMVLWWARTKVLA